MTISINLSVLHFLFFGAIQELMNNFFCFSLSFFFFLADENSTSTYRYKKQGQKLRKLRGYYKMWPLGKELDNQKQVDWL